MCRIGEDVVGKTFCGVALHARHEMRVGLEHEGGRRPAEAFLDDLEVFAAASIREAWV